MSKESEKQSLWSGWETAKIIGRGSYGSVYQIERDIPGRADKERAALKVMSIPRSHEDILELTSQGYDKASITKYFRSQLDELIKEYAVMLELKGHTNIVYCDELKWTQHDDGIGWNVYIKMELLKPLKAVLGNKYDERTVLQLGIDIARALVRCREKNIIHRDIKPQNIMVSSKGDYKLGDFGVAKVSERTSSGTIAGTYEYMAPEVFRGEAYNSTADIYSLGIVMYWMMNNKRTPFLPQPPDIPSSADMELARTRRFSGEKMPEPVHGSDTLKAIVLKACAFYAEERFQSAQELLEALESVRSEMVENTAYAPTADGHGALQEQNVSHKIARKPSKGKKSILVLGLLPILLILSFFMADNRKSRSEAPLAQSNINVPTVTVPSNLPTEELDTPVPSEEETNRWEQNVLKPTERGLWDARIYGTEIKKEDIRYVTFLDTIENAPANSIDVSESGDKSVLAWFGSVDDKYEMFIAGDGGVNGVNSCFWLFGHFISLEQVRFNGNFHTDQAKDMSHMFFNCESLQKVDAETLRTDSAENLDNTFASCKKLQELNLNSWNTSNVNNFGSLFDYCYALEKLDLSNWNTINAQSMARMFHSCQQLKWLDIGGFYSKNLTWTDWMFKDCYNLEYLNMESFDTAGVVSVESMFQNCHKLQNVNMANFDTSSVEKKNSFMGEGKTINGVSWKEYFSSQKRSWENNVLRNDYGGLWENPVFGTEITKEQIVSVTFLDTLANSPSTCIDASEAGDGSVLAWVSGYDDTYELFFAGEGGVCAPESCQWLFGYYTNCKQFNFNGNFHTDYVKDMSSLFYGCSSLTDVDISTLNTSSVENFDGMFGATRVTDLDLRTLDTSNATDLYRMFIFCYDLKHVDVSTWDTSKVENMGWMFYHCTSLEQLDLSNFDTSSVTEFYRMFSGCTKLRSVDVSSFNTSAATNMQEMFNECPLLEEMDLSHFNISNVEKYNNFMDHSKKINGKSWLKMFS